MGQEYFQNLPNNKSKNMASTYGGSTLGFRSKSHKQLLIEEFNWNDKFNVMASKNNLRIHRNFKEYFDKPIDYDV